jgi:hypothetical protein
MTDTNRQRSRRAFLGLAASGAGSLVVGCGGPKKYAALVAADTSVTPANTVVVPGLAADPSNPSSPTPTPRPVPAAGTSERMLLEGTPWQTRAVVAHSGVAGKTLMVLGGVHGNEPGGWMAAEEVATWTPARGSLVVVPRANIQAIPEFVRTRDDLGDLNRLYPGSPEAALPMERMAAAIVALAKEVEADLLLDMHESWAFYAERSQNGTAFLGQTVTTGVGPLNPALGKAVIATVDAEVSGRDTLYERDGANLQRDPTLGTPSSPGAVGNRGRSSLSLGGFVTGLTPLLVEMGQQDQPISRRTELHLMVARAVMAELGMA